MLCYLILNENDPIFQLKTMMIGQKEKSLKLKQRKATNRRKTHWSCKEKSDDHDE